MSTKHIQFPCQITKVQTMGDGGVRLTLDLPETATVLMSMLASIQVGGFALSGVLTAYDGETEAAPIKPEITEVDE